MNAELSWSEKRSPAGRKALETTYEYLIKDLIKEAPSDAVRLKIVETGKPGNLFLYRDGKVMTR